MSNVDPEVSTLVEDVPVERLEEAKETFTVHLLDGDSIKSQWELPTEIHSPWGSTSSPWNTNVERLLTTQQSMSLPRFFSLAAELIQVAQEDKEESKRVTLVEEYPPDPFDSYGDEVIAFRLLRREPAKMNAKGTGRPQRRSLHERYESSPHYPNKVVEIESRPLDHLIEFTCWAKTNKDANRTALWLEQLFVTHSWVFESRGVEKFFFKDRGPDTYFTSQGQRLFYRPINFTVRFREFFVKAHPKIKNVVLEGNALVGELPLANYRPTSLPASYCD